MSDEPPQYQVSRWFLHLGPWQKLAFIGAILVAAVGLAVLASIFFPVTDDDKPQPDPPSTAITEVESTNHHTLNARYRATGTV